MSVLKTENRLAANVAAMDPDEAVVTADAKSALISFVTSPVVVGWENIYVVFVTDPALAGSVESFEWRFGEKGGALNVQTTQQGEIAYYIPSAIGPTELTGRFFGAGNSEQGLLTQDIAAPDAEIEAAIAAAQNETKPASAIRMCRFTEQRQKAISYHWYPFFARVQRSSLL